MQQTLSAQPQRQLRLSRQQKDELVLRHRAGTFEKELARVYRIHVETVRAIIRTHERSALAQQG